MSKVQKFKFPCRTHRSGLSAPRGITASVAGPESESNWKNALLLTKFLQVLPVTTTTILEFSEENFSSSARSPLFLQLTIRRGLSYYSHFCNMTVIPQLVIRSKLLLSSLETFNGQPI